MFGCRLARPYLPWLRASMAFVGRFSLGWCIVYLSPYKSPNRLVSYERVRHHYRPYFHHRQHRCCLGRYPLALVAARLAPLLLGNSSAGSSWRRGIQAFGAGSSPGSGPSFHGRARGLRSRDRTAGYPATVGNSFPASAALCTPQPPYNPLVYNGLGF